MMHPVYDVDGITIYHADCADVLPSIDPVTVGLLLTDPPYGIGLDTDYSGLSGNSDFNSRKGNYQGKTYARVHGDDASFDPIPLFTFGRVVLFGPDHFYETLPAGGSFHCWDKRDGMNPNMLSDFELFWSSFSSGPSRLFRHKWLGYMRQSEVGKHYHPTQKPVSLMRWILEQWTEPGDLVLDPYMGSGPVARACADLGRRYVGIEIVEEYVDTAIARLGQTAMVFA